VLDANQESPLGCSCSLMQINRNGIFRWRTVATDQSELLRGILSGGN